MPFSMTLNDYPGFNVTPFLTRNIYLRTGTIYRRSFNGKLIRTYPTVSFRMTLGDLDWHSKIFNDKKRCAPRGLSATAEVLVLFVPCGELYKLATGQLFTAR